MIFELLPTIDIMLDLYSKPRTTGRFHEYLKLLQGDTKGDLLFPISGFNPMGKEHIVEKLMELRAMNAEELMKQTLQEINKKTDTSDSRVFKVALNLLDDLKGGWTNRYPSDYDSKFKLNALIKRQFCIPVFWSGENYSSVLIQERTMEYVLRTIYRLTHSQPITFKDHIEQEQYVASHSCYGNKKQEFDIKPLDIFYKHNKNSDEYHIIFNFLYGDEACKSLEFPVCGIPGVMPGYRYAEMNCDTTKANL
jgi:hypothetical protein